MDRQLDSPQDYDTHILNHMLRGEMAAVETYNHAIENTQDPSLKTDLTRIRDEHQNSVCALRHWVRDLDETPAPSSGVWGSFAVAVTKLAAFVGEKALLAALERGERHGEAVYRRGMGNPDLPDDFRHLVGSRLLPQCQVHLGKLEQIALQASPTQTASAND